MLMGASFSDGHCRSGGARQFAPAFADFLGLPGLALTAFREDAGLMLRGLPETTGVTSGAASGSLKYTRQPGVS